MRGRLDTIDNRLITCNAFGDVSDEDKMIAACKKGVRCIKEVMDNVFDTYYPENATASVDKALKVSYALKFGTMMEKSMTYG